MDFLLHDPVSGNPSIPFTLYAMECEGDLPTEQGKYNKMIKNLRELASTRQIDQFDVCREATAADLNEPTPEKIDDIIMEVLYGLNVKA